MKSNVKDAAQVLITSFYPCFFEYDEKVLESSNCYKKSARH